MFRRTSRLLTEASRTGRFPPHSFDEKVRLLRIVDGDMSELKEWRDQTDDSQMKFRLGELLKFYAGFRGDIVKSIKG